MFDDFDAALASYWTQTRLGPGMLTVSTSTLRLALSEVQEGHYADAQIDDYGTLARSAFPWKPPLRMEVRSRASLPAAIAADPNGNFLRGTAGFGFWNYPFSVRGDVLMLPEAVWFFYASPPSNMALVPGIPGWGWKAQVIHSMRPGVNHTEWGPLAGGAGSIGGNIGAGTGSFSCYGGPNNSAGDPSCLSSSNFLHIGSALPGRILQLGAKFLF